MTATVQRRTALIACLMGVAIGAGCKDRSTGTPASAPAAEVPASLDALSPDLSKSNPPGSLSHSDPTNRAVGVDHQDDPRGPDFLPKSGKDGAWIKTEPVRVYDPGELGTALIAEDTPRLGYFRIRSVVRCVYQLPHSAAQKPLARVVVISTETPEDAYGILACRAPGTEQFRIAGETRVTRRDGIGLHAWQGTAYVNVACDRSDSETTEELIRLTNFITGRIRRESPPRMLDAMPRDNSTVYFRWLLRNVASLPPDAFELAGRLDPRKLSEVLGLSRETLMCVGAYSVRGGEPNVVWIVQYPNVRAAHDAAARYRKYLDDHASDPLAVSTNLLAPQGVYLAGTWTAELESMQYMLPRIQQLLPSQ